jgi:CMP-N-acetylneuraminic acid synthetase
MDILGIIPARGGSKGVLRKNVRPLAGRPLIAYTIDAARGSKLLTRFLCSTEDWEIAKIANELGCPVLARPAELAGDATSMKSVIKHVLSAIGTKEAFQPEIAVLLQPTSPLRSCEHIDRALEMLIESGADSVVSVAPVPGHYHPDWQLKLDLENRLALWNDKPLSELVTRRQDLLPSFTRNGAVYAFRVASFMKSDSIYGERCLGFEMKPEESINIDSESDVSLADLRLTETMAATPGVEAHH